MNQTTNVTRMAGSRKIMVFSKETMTTPTRISRTKRAKSNNGVIHFSPLLAMNSTKASMTSRRVGVA
jgi:hypothetical protein